MGHHTNDYWSVSLKAHTRILEEFPGLDPRANDVVLFLNRASGNLTSALEEKVHSRLGLTWSGYRFLFVLWVMGDLRPHQIAALTNSSRALVSALTGQFLAEKLISRQRCNDDGRAVNLSLTASGREKVRAAFQSQNEVQVQMLSRLTTTEQEILRMLVAKLMGSTAPPIGLPAEQ